MSRDLLTIEEIAEHFNVSPSTVRRWIRSGKLLGTKAGAQWRFEKSAVMDAYRRGLLSGKSQPLSGDTAPPRRPQEGPWATEFLGPWKQSLELCLDELRPHHVVVNDRRGAKVWMFITPGEYEWGENLWHSTAIRLMGRQELRRLFRGKTVLLFDEMMQHGRAMSRLRHILETAGATVASFVCFCKKSRLEAGDTLEYKARTCEVLDDFEFSQRATLISRLISLSAPPCDVDHLVVRGRIKKTLSAEQIVAALANWGLTFVVAFPDPDNGRDFLAITLDRPEFFDTEKARPMTGFEFSWNGPCKVRLYVNLRTGECFCAFIVYPQVRGTMGSWLATPRELPASDHGTAPEAEAEPLPESDRLLMRRYEMMCIDFAISLMRDFFLSGAAGEIGYAPGNTRDAIDGGQLRATFGLELGTQIERKVRAVLSESGGGGQLSFSRPTCSALVAARKRPDAGMLSRDLFACRLDFLKLMPLKAETESQEGRQKPITYFDLLGHLPSYSESTIGQVLDYEIDWGTVKPAVYNTYRPHLENEPVEVGRGFYRGEFDPPLQVSGNPILTHDDHSMQQMLGIGPTVLDEFLRRAKQQDLLATHFAKVFANLWEDWDRRFDPLYYSLRPYKYGPIPVVLQATSSDIPLRLERFLIERGCIEELKTAHGSQIRLTYRPADESRMPWRTLFEKLVDGPKKAYIRGLVRLYCAIQNSCHTQRRTREDSPYLSVFTDPLVVLASARNQKMAYISGLFEVTDWCNNGRVLFETLQAIAQVEKHYAEPHLAVALAALAEPARLLHQKLDMYQNIPSLREQIVRLRDTDDFEMADVTLATIDKEPIVECDSEYPIGNLIWACQIMRAFSSFTRQVLTSCGLDQDNRRSSERADGEGRIKDASFYLEQRLFPAAPELLPLKGELREVVTLASRGVLTARIADSLQRTFKAILGLVEDGKRVPRARLGSETPDVGRTADLRICLREIARKEPYAVAVADVANFVNLAKLLAGLGANPDDAVDALVKTLKTCAQQVVKAHPGVVWDISGDAVILAGQNLDEVYLAMHHLIRLTTQSVVVREKRLGEFALLCAGLAWHEEGRGLEFAGLFPGLTAMKISDRGREPGDIIVTQAVYERLSEEHRQQFTKCEGQSSGQGDLYVRHWNPDVDMH